MHSIIKMNQRQNRKYKDQRKVVKPASKEEPIVFSDFLKTIDCDLMESMYHVYSAVKKTYPLDVDHLNYNNQLEQRKHFVIDHCDKYVLHKIFFMQMLKDVQEKRKRSAYADIKWYDRELLNYHFEGLKDE